MKTAKKLSHRVIAAIICLHYQKIKPYLGKTMRTGVAELTQPHVAEMMLGHKLPGIWQIYDKHTYLEEQREAYER